VVARQGLGIRALGGGIDAGQGDRVISDGLPGGAQAGSCAPRPEYCPAVDAYTLNHSGSASVSAFLRAAAIRPQPELYGDFDQIWLEPYYRGAWTLPTR
jgi:hypothetical protein